MENMVISKEGFDSLLARLINDYQVIAPVKQEEQVLLRNVSDPADIYLEFKGVPLSSPKRFLFPEKEILFTYETTDSKEEVVIYDKYEELKNVSHILIGIRPCDIKALLILDKVLMGEYHDPYYAVRRRNAVIIGLTCNEPAETCFCTFTDSGPDAEEGFDLLLTDLDDVFFVKIGSKRGERLIKLNLDLFRRPSEEDYKERYKVLKNVREKINQQKLPNLLNLYEPMVKLFNNEIWDKYGKSCVACGKCNFICPTCRCFNIYDDPNLDAKSGKRVRAWDSCHFLSFTQVAGGVIFRKERPSRVKQRIYHKYCYSIDEIGLISCVGCGRCIDVCSANIDIREALAEVAGIWHL